MPNRALSRRSLLAVVATIGVVTVGLPGLAAADPPDTVTLPSHQSAFAVSATEIASDAGNWAYTYANPDMTSTIVRHPSGGSTASTQVAHTAVALDMVGNQLGYLDLDQITGDVTGHILDVSTGVDTTVPIAKREIYLGITSGGLLIGQPQLDDSLTLVERTIVGGNPNDTQVGSVPNESYIDTASLSDATGWAYVGVDPSTANSDPQFHVHFVDLSQSSNNDTDLGIADGEPSLEQLSPTYVYWATSTSLVRANRDGSQNGHASRALDNLSVTAMAVTDDTVMFSGFSNDSLFGASSFGSAASKGAASRQSARRQSVLANGTVASPQLRWAALTAAHNAMRSSQRTAAAESATRSSSRSGARAALDITPFTAVVGAGDGTGSLNDVAGGDFVAAMAGSSTQLYAAVGFLAGSAYLDTVSASGTVAHVEALPAAQATVYGLDVSPGRLSYSDDRAADVPLFSRTISTAGGLTVGASDQQGIHGPVLSVSASGNRQAITVETSAGGFLVLVVEGTKILRRVNVPGAFDVPTVTLSGNRLLISGFFANGELIDLSTGAVSHTGLASALHGEDLSYADPAGNVFVRELDKPKLKPHKVASKLCDGNFGCIFDTRVYDDYVAWSSFLSNTGDPDVANWRTGGAAVEVPTAGSPFGLGDGRILYLQQVGSVAQLVARDLTNLAGPAVPLADVGASEFAIDDDGVLAWVGTDGRPRVGTVSAVIGRVLGAAPPAFSPNGNGRHDVWNARLVTSKAVSSWSLAITSPSGGAVRSFSGSGPLGVAAVNWDGTNAKGKQVPDGTYHYRFTATAADGTGAIRSPSGTSSTTTGTIGVRRTAPAVRVIAKPLSSSFSIDNLVIFGWVNRSAGIGPLTYDVRYRVHSAFGHVSGLHKLFTGTSRQVGFIRGVAGDSYDISVRAHDALGNAGPWSHAVRTTVPYDDFSHRVHYSSDWSSVRGNPFSAWQGTLHFTTIAGQSAKITGHGRTVEILGHRCKYCGKMQVWIDGRKVATVDTKGSGTVTPGKWPVVFKHSLRAGTHSVRIVVLGTPGRRRVNLDAIAFLP